MTTADTTTWMVLDRMRTIENHCGDLKQADLRREMKQAEHDRILKTLTDSTHAISTDVSAMSLQISVMATQMAEITKWSKRVLLAVGLVGLAAQHLTLPEMAKIIRVVVASL